MASLLMIVRRSLRRHFLSTAVTAVSIALSSGLTMAVFSISAQSTSAFGGGQGGWDAVLGAKGSPTQLVLNTIYHLETSPGNIPWEYYTRLANDPRIRLAVPYALGDNYKGYRVVGTTRELFTEFEYAPGRHFTAVPDQLFDPLRAEAVIGATVARELGMGRGDRFRPYHGLASHSGAEEHELAYTVISVLEPTNTPADKVIWIPIEGVFRMPGHIFFDEEGHELHAGLGKTIPDADKEISAVMLKLSDPRAGQMLAFEFNRQGKDATLVWPVAAVMAKLLKDLGWVNRILEAVAYLIVFVTGGALLAALYNTMNERRREFAILRALGARRRTVFGVIVLEAASIAMIGVTLGYGVYFGILLLAARIVRDSTGVVLDLGLVHPSLYWTPLGIVGLGALAGLLPAFKAYSTDVAAHLTRA